MHVRFIEDSTLSIIVHALVVLELDKRKRVIENGWADFKYVINPFRDNDYSSGQLHKNLILIPPAPK